MKKFLFIILIIFSLSSCQNNQEPEKNITLPLTMTVNLSGSNSSFTAELTETESRITFDQSHPLYGTEILLGETENTVSAGDFKRTVKKGIFPAQEAFVKAIKTISSQENSGVKTENGAKYTIDEMTIMVYYDKDTKQIIGIGTEESGKRFEFNITAVDPYEAQSNSQG